MKSIKIKKPVGPDYKQGFNDGYEKGLEDAYADASRVVNVLYICLFLVFGFFSLYLIYQPK